MNLYILDKPDGKPVTSIPVNNNEEYATVVRTRLESHSLGTSIKIYLTLLVIITELLMSLQ